MGSGHDGVDRVKVFVHLAPGMDAELWHRNWVADRVIGINEPTPYGYHLAEQLGCSVEFSRGRPEGLVARYWRLAVGAVVGFDLVHAWRNREGIRSADAVWTHTETQGLAVAALLSRVPRRRRPVLILQNIWLLDRWPTLSPVRRALFRRLYRDADVLTFHTASGTETGRRLFRGVRCELVRFGIAIDQKRAPDIRESPSPLRVLAVGNDEHRDWRTAVEVVAGIPDASLDVVSRTFPDALRSSRAVTVHEVTENPELRSLFASADLLLLALSPNGHASGITVMQEATLSGIPIVATDTGGLTDYFDHSMVEYVLPGDVDGARRAVEGLAADPDRRRLLVERAQARMSRDGVSSFSFVRRHVELTRQLLADRARVPSDSAATTDPSA